MGSIDPIYYTVGRWSVLGLYQKYFKRAFDFTISTLALICFSPVLATVAIMIKRDDGGSVFYRGERAGRNCKTFKIFKFRTMVVNADKVGGPSTSEDDPRITKLGARLRKYKIDELPQFINVFEGEMSIVGPRPEIPSEIETYNEKEKGVLAVRPGITDWSSIKFRNEGEILRGSADPHQAYREKIKPEKIRLGLEYVNNVSFRTDILIIIKTIRAILSSSEDPE